MQRFKATNGAIWSMPNLNSAPCGIHSAEVRSLEGPDLERGTGPPESLIGVFNLEGPDLRDRTSKNGDRT